jgi:AraC family transcriptional regulator of adaptative response/methylated-DNA-[protein]-cysteine methyltransferase
MKKQHETDFNRIAEAITFIRANFKSQPALDEVARQIHLSPFHFQRLFTDWAGVSPKRFLQYITVEYAKNRLAHMGTSLSDVAFESGLSGTSRLHDLFIKIEGMTPGEYKNGAENLSINYSFAETNFGNLLVASTSKGICYMAFTDDEKSALELLQKRFPQASYRQVLDRLQQNALLLFNEDREQLHMIKLHLKGTEFQLKVWEALLKVPSGRLTTYGAVAETINSPKASRAVGTAIGQNPVAFLIPCHRVIQSSGIFGGYMWGADRKAAMIGWEAARAEKINEDQGVSSL